MKAAMGREKYLAITLASAAVLLCGVLAWEWKQGLDLEHDLLGMRNIPVTPVKAPNTMPEFSLPAADAGFPELITRSLFSISRRSAGAAAKGVSAMKKGQFVLVGVLITPQQKSALLRDVQTNKTETVASAAVVRGMTLGEVEASRVVLHQGAESEELILNVQTGPKTPASGRSAAQPAQSAAVAAPPVPPAAPASAASAPARAASGVSPPASAPVGAPPAKPMGAASGPPPGPPGLSMLPPPGPDPKK